MSLAALQHDLGSPATEFDSLDFSVMARDRAVSRKDRRPSNPGVRRFRLWGEGLTEGGVDG
jgi:hypothetical protein